jgi:hypothetical protein
MMQQDFATIRNKPVVQSAAPGSGQLVNHAGQSLVSRAACH